MQESWSKCEQESLEGSSETSFTHTHPGSGFLRARASELQMELLSPWQEGLQRESHPSAELPGLPWPATGNRGSSQEENKNHKKKKSGFKVVCRT